MQRRLVRWGLIVLGAAALLAAGLASQFKSELAFWLMAPSVPYSEMRILPRPVYIFPDAWAVHPDKDDFADLVPQGLGISDNQSTAQADVFFIHPTTYFGEDWNAEYNDPAASAIVDGLVMAAQASAFNGCCRVFAPRYRQAHAAAFLQPSASGRNAIDLAYVDVLRAFEEYIREWNDGRPFIIAGHSQGAVMAMRLLGDRLDEPPLRSLLVGAYIIGAGVPLDRFETNWQTIAACESATDIGCVVSWESYVDGVDPVATPNILEVWYDRHWVTLADGERSCTNPLSWSRQPGRAEAELNLGAIPVGPGVKPGLGLALGGTPVMDPNDFATIPTPMAGLTWAECRDGFLFVEEPTEPVFRTSMLGDGNLHAYDFALFYMNIRQNAQDRVEAYFGAGD